MLGIWPATKFRPKPFFLWTVWGEGRWSSSKTAARGTTTIDTSRSSSCRARTISRCYRRCSGGASSGSSQRSGAKMRTWSATPAQIFWKLRWPASVPFLFTSVKVSITISLIGAIVAELPTGAQAGIGARLLAGSYYGQTIQIWAALVAASLLAVGLIGLVSFFERWVAQSMGARA